MSQRRNKIDRKILFIVMLLFIFLACGNASSESQNYWPSGAWRTASPESQGMNSDILADMVRLIMFTPNTIDSVTIIRNGYIVLDAYFYPFRKDKAHTLHSCTKSITSTLVGIAIDKGYIKDVHQRLLDFFPEITPANMTEEKKNISLENILTMATGLECKDNFKYRWQGLAKMWRSSNWTQYMLDLPMNAAPGQHFDYCNGATYLLSAIIQKSTGERAYKFAMDNLFAPMGITDVKWYSNPQGIDIGYGGMWMKPHDMAKFGWLFLNKGKWQGNTIVSEDWVAKATIGYLEAWFSAQYGYQWWIADAGYYEAVGYAGQRIFVVPKQNMVVVFTSFESHRKPGILMRSYIFKAIESNSPLPDNIDGNTRLNELVEKCSKHHKPFPVPDLPPLSQTISGVKYNIEPNDTGFGSIGFNFGLKNGAAIMEFILMDKQHSVEIGLDGVYRITELHEETVSFEGDWLNEKFITVGSTVACKGEWLNEDTFRFSFVNVGHTDGASAEIKFIGDNAEISMIGPSGSRLRLKGVRP
jgi:CubicO group peptidase (beta-lactamase class C family)